MEEKSEQKSDKEFWAIYVDETYVEPEHHMITAFWAVNEFKEEKIFSKYCSVVYQSGTLLEAKSTTISDELNTDALKTTKGYCAKCVINDLNLSQIDKEIKSVDLAINIYSYLLPLKQVLRQIQKVTKKRNVLVKIIIDNLSNFQPGSPFELYSYYFLDLIEKDCSSEKVTFKLKWLMMDSKNSIGIQIADLICGAYRKEMRYRRFQPHIKLIPFNYLKFHENESPLNNKDFLQIYALVNLLPKPELRKEPKKQPKNVNNSTLPKLHLLCDFTNLKKLIRDMNIVLLTSLAQSYEKKVLICNILHQHFNEIFRETNYYMALKQKYTKDKDCISVINNFRKNLMTLGRLGTNGQINGGEVECKGLRNALKEIHAL